ncbi:MAG: AAA family ATPase [Oscillospiraceae bacterium]|jgi:hypothetical protein|nr:AAA family ATPase [Oscillospiraceae bacterium]
MIIWINGAFGAGKTTCAYELHRRLTGSYVFDPEHIGYFFFKHFPKTMRRGDFQDYALWRSFNRDMLELIYKEFAGVIIVPMTLTDPGYFDEIIGSLRRGGADVRHFILAAGRDTLRHRLNRRIEHGETWAKAQIERCVTAFETVIDGEKITTDGVPIDSVVEAIAEKCALTLAPDKRLRLRKSFDRTMTLLRHIR